MTSLINILQLESVRKNTTGYKPRSIKPYVDVSGDGSKQVNPSYSDHATYVAQLWQAHGAADLVANYYVCSLSDFDYSINRPGRMPMLEALKNIHIVIAPGGESWEAVSNFSINKLQGWCEAHNALFIKSPADLGQGFYQFPSQAVGDNILTLASSTTGSETNGMPPVDLYFPVDWNSYAQPSVLSAGGLLALVDWILQSGLPYTPKDLRKLLIADGIGSKPVFNGGAVLAQLKSSHPSAPPAPQPPAPVSTPAPVLAPPVATVPPVAAGTLPGITRFDIGVSSAWSSPTAPTYFNIQTNGADSVTLTDPKGITQDVTGQPQVKAEGKYTDGCIWTLKATNKSGTASKVINFVHGCF